MNETYPTLKVATFWNISELPDSDQFKAANVCSNSILFMIPGSMLLYSLL